MTHAHDIKRELQDAKREHTVTVLRGLMPVTFLLPHRKVNAGKFFSRRALIHLFAPLVDAYAGSKVDDFRRQVGFREGQGSSDDFSALLARSGQSLREIYYRSDLKLNFSVCDFAPGCSTSRPVQPKLSPVFNKAVMQAWAAPSARKLVAGFRTMASKHAGNADYVELDRDIYVTADAMDYQINRGLRILAHIDHALRHERDVSAEDRKLWDYLNDAIVRRPSPTAKP